jgi:staphylococcal nuclease domain-containing protein 1
LLDSYLLQVNVTMEYSRKVGMTDGPTPGPANPGSDRTMDFGSVFLVSAPKAEAADTTSALPVSGQPQGVNVAEMLVVRGFATVVRHRDFEERSNYYEALLAAESKAVKGKKKIHSQKESPVAHINDLSLVVCTPTFPVLRAI